MTTHDARARLRTIVSKALDGCRYEDTRREDERMLLIEARRPDGTRVHLRFRGVRDSEATAAPEAGASLRLAGVDHAASGFHWWQVFVPRFPRPGEMGDARVTIAAGSARIEVVCQDAEWWEDPPGAVVEAGTQDK